MATGAAGVREFVPEDSGVKEEGWLESDMAAKLLFEERPRMRHLQRPAEETFAEKLEVKPENNLETASKESYCSGENANTRNAD